MVILRLFAASLCGLSLSLAWTVKLKPPSVVGVPEITPLPARLNTGGKEPEVILHM
jgi:hypothetical protein